MFSSMNKTDARRIHVLIHRKIVKKMEDLSDAGHGTVKAESEPNEEVKY